MKSVPVFDHTDLYRIRYLGTSNFVFNGDTCESWIRILNIGKIEFPEGAGLFLMTHKNISLIEESTSISRM
jgi:hypothetical protein